MRSRFTLNTRLDFYNRDDLLTIVHRTCRLLNVPIDDTGAREIAARSRGTPRIVNNLVNFVRDYAQEKAQGRITQPAAAAALELLLEIDALGLDEMDKRILRLMAEAYHGGPVGLGTVAVAVGEETETLEEVHEPYKSRRVISSAPRRAACSRREAGRPSASNPARPPARTAGDVVVGDFVRPGSLERGRSRSRPSSTGAAVSGRRHAVPAGSWGTR